MSIQFLNTSFSNPIILASSPLTETAEHIRKGELHGAAGAILKTSCSYTRQKDYDTRKVIFSSDHSHYYASSSFEREILTAEEGLRLYCDAVKSCSIPIIPSVTALTLYPHDWLPLCSAFQKMGAEIIQLDFFYLGAFLSQPNFAEKVYDLLNTLAQTLSCQIIPKVNIDLPADFIFKIVAAANIKGVSLLDSVRVPLVDASGNSTLPFSYASYFGEWQLPLSLHYAHTARQYGLEICGGGGITNNTAVMQMMSCGASITQIASAILLHGYDKIQELMPITKKKVCTSTVFGPIHYEVQKNKCTRCYICTNSSAWCDAITVDMDGIPFIQRNLCEDCGWCAARCPANAISGSNPHFCHR